MNTVGQDIVGADHNLMGLAIQTHLRDTERAIVIVIARTVQMTERVRMDLELSTKQAAAINRLCQQTGMSQSQVIGAALTLFGVAIKENLAGNNIVIARNGLIIKHIVGLTGHN